MREKPWILTFFLIFLLFQKQASANPPLTLSTHVDRDSVTVGDEIIYEISVSHPRDVIVRFPDEHFDFSPFELKRYRPLSRREKEGEVTEGMRYFLTIFRLGVSKIPPLPISYIDYRERTLPGSPYETAHSIEKGTGSQGTVTTEPTEITVVSVLGEETPAEMDIQRLKVEKENRLFSLFGKMGKILLAIGMICIGIYGGIRLLPKPHFSIERKDPVQSRLRDLETVKTGLKSLGPTAHHYEALSELLRRYLAGQFDPLPLHLTTSELRQKMLQYPPCIAIAEKVYRILWAADLVKFANREISREELMTFVKEAEEIIRYQEPTVTGSAPS